MQRFSSDGAALSSDMRDSVPDWEGESSRPTKRNADSIEAKNATLFETPYYVPSRLQLFELDDTSILIALTFPVL